MSSSIVLLSRPGPKTRNNETKIKDEILDIISFRPQCCNSLDEEHYREHTYAKRFCNRLKLIKQQDSDGRQADSFFADGKPGNLARVFAAIAPRGVSQIVSNCTAAGQAASASRPSRMLVSKKSQDGRYLTVD